MLGSGVEADDAEAGAVMALIYTLLVAHFVADFLCQSDWMALNKSKSWWALTSHVAAYSAGLIVAGSLWLAWNNGWRSPMPMDAVVFFAVNAAAHFVQDAITSRITSRLWFIKLTARHGYEDGTSPQCEWYAHVQQGKRHWFFVVIGADQLLHYVTLFVTAEWWLR